MRDRAPTVRLSSTRWLFVPAVTLLVGLVVTVVLVLISHNQYLNNEEHALKLRVRDAGALLTATVPRTQTTLASAAELAAATDGNVKKFASFASPYVGNGTERQFGSLSLWRLADVQRGPFVVAGTPPGLAARSSEVPGFFARAAASRTLAVMGLLQANPPRIGYAYAAGGFVAYAESPLPQNRHSRYQSTSAFAGLDYAIYLGRKESSADLLVTDLSKLPPRGRTAAVSIPFGDSALTLVMVSRGSLTGGLPEDLPWIIAIVGTLLAIAAALGGLLLIRRRRGAEQLAAKLAVTASENELLYAEQRNIARTLQQALLPDELPQLPGVQTSARYQPGEHGVDIGGDWYDVIDLGAGRLLLVVGDVSGRGLKAASTMAALRYAIQAYAAQSDSPAEILGKVARLLNISDDGQLATILCVLVDASRGEITVTSAGHLPPLLIAGGHGRFLTGEVGVPIGVDSGATYRSATISVPDDATLIAFTDGLVERRGENLDDGLARLLKTAISEDGELPELLHRLTSTLGNGHSEDDIAIVGVRWSS